MVWLILIGILVAAWMLDAVPGMWTRIWPLISRAARLFVVWMIAGMVLWHFDVIDMPRNPFWFGDPGWTYQEAGRRPPAVQATVTPKPACKPPTAFLGHPSPRPGSTLGADLGDPPDCT